MPPLKIHYAPQVKNPRSRQFMAWLDSSNILNRTVKYRLCFYKYVVKSGITYSATIGLLQLLHNYVGIRLISIVWTITRD